MARSRPSVRVELVEGGGRTLWPRAPGRVFAAARSRTFAALADAIDTAFARYPQARTDAFFDPKGQKVVAALLLAAALVERTIEQAYLWVADPRDDEPVSILREHDHPLLAASLAAEIDAPDKQRGGVYGTAEKILAFLTNRNALSWVTPGPGRVEFDTHEIVRGTGTLYSLSKEGKGSTGALVAGLTVAVTEAAEEHAKRSPGGRLPVPLLAVLDEAANVCRWPELPNLYSHYGSRLPAHHAPIVVARRRGLGPRRHAKALVRRHHQVKLYGGGVSEVDFLSDLSQLIGEFTQHTTSVSHAKGGRTSTHATQRERVLDVADLAALPKGRAIVLAAGAPPALVRTLPWMAGPRAGEVRLSLREHDPAAATTLDQAATSLDDVQSREQLAPAFRWSTRRHARLRARRGSRRQRARTLAPNESCVLLSGDEDRDLGRQRVRARSADARPVLFPQFGGERGDAHC